MEAAGRLEGGERDECGAARGGMWHLRVRSGGRLGEAVLLLESLVVVDLAVVDQGVAPFPHERLLAVQGVHDRKSHVREAEAGASVEVCGAGKSQPSARTSAWMLRGRGLEQKKEGGRETVGVWAARLLPQGELQHLVTKRLHVLGAFAPSIARHLILRGIDNEVRRQRCSPVGKFPPPHLQTDSPSDPYPTAKKIPIVEDQRRHGISVCLPSAERLVCNLDASIRACCFTRFHPDTLPYGELWQFLGTSASIGPGRP